MKAMMTLALMLLTQTTFSATFSHTYVDLGYVCNSSDSDYCKTVLKNYCNKRVELARKEMQDQCEILGGQTDLTKEHVEYTDIRFSYNDRMLDHSLHCSFKYKVECL